MAAGSTNVYKVHQVHGNIGARMKTFQFSGVFSSRFADNYCEISSSILAPSVLLCWLGFHLYKHDSSFITDEAHAN